MRMPKEYLLHIYYGDEYIDSAQFPSREALAHHLRDELRLQFPNERLSLLAKGDSAFFKKGEFEFEAEEIPPSQQSYEKDGKLYIPIDEYCKLRKVKKSKVAYAMRMGRIDGLWIGPNRCRYIAKGARLCQ